jgi:hypothetical protein
VFRTVDSWEWRVWRRESDPVAAALDYYDDPNLGDVFLNCFPTTSSSMSSSAYVEAVILTDILVTGFP